MDAFSYRQPAVGEQIIVRQTANGLLHIKLENNLYSEWSCDARNSSQLPSCLRRAAATAIEAREFPRKTRHGPVSDQYQTLRGRWPAHPAKRLPTTSTQKIRKTCSHPSLFSRCTSGIPPHVSAMVNYLRRNRDSWFVLALPIIAITSTVVTCAEKGGKACPTEQRGMEGV